MPRIAPLPWDSLDPESRRRIEEGVASGMYPETSAMRVMAHSPEALEAMHEGYRAIYGRSALGQRLQELLRIRSAQLNGCDLCAAARKDESLTDEDIRCMLEADTGAYSQRERLALRLLTLMAADPQHIDGAIFRELGQHFTTREVVELAWFCGNCLGVHRMMHALDMLGQEPPILGLETAAVSSAGATNAVAHGDNR